MTHTRAIPLFALASLFPAGCLLAAAAWGGYWPFAALLSMTAVVMGMDRVGLSIEAGAGASRWLPVTIGLLHFAILTAVVAAVAAPQAMTLTQDVTLVIAAGLFAGQVSNACAHELIHRPDKFSRFLGTAIYCSILNGQHVSAHMLVHHVHAGTDKDPNTAPLGVGFYRYLTRAWLGEFRAGLKAETARRTRGWWRHPYAVYLSGAAFSLIIAGIAGGNVGVFVLVIIALHAQAQLFLSDYVQHYGLRRKIRPNGKPEPMGLHHSWNAPHAYSAAMMLNAPRHSDHHMRPDRTFTALEICAQTMPVLPRSVPVMGAVALVPPLWHRMMDDRARYWSGQADPAPEATATTPPLVLP